MKIHLMFLTLALMAGLACAQDAVAPRQEGEVITDLGWNIIPRIRDPALDFQSESSGTNKTFQGVKLVYSVTQLGEFALCQAGLPSWETRQTHAYAITGEMQFEDGWPGSFLQLRCHTTTRRITAGPPIDFVKEDGWQSFRYDFDPNEIAASPGPLLEVHLSLAGPCILHFRNLKLVQYPWSSASIRPSGPSQVVEQISGNELPEVFTIKEKGGPLWSTMYPKLTAKHFAVTGEARYENAPNRYLEMITEFLPKTPGDSSPQFIIRNQADEGLLQKFDGTSNWRPFWLPFDSSISQTRLVSVGINANTVAEADKSGVVYLRDLKLVQFPDESFPTPLAPSGNIPPPELVKPDQPPPAAPALVAPTTEVHPNVSTVLDPATLSENYLKAQIEMINLKKDRADLLLVLREAHPTIIALNQEIEKKQLLLDTLQLDLKQNKSAFVEWKSFFLGVFTVVFVAMIAFSFRLLTGQLKARRDEREMRRMASIDS